MTPDSPVQRLGSHLIVLWATLAALLVSASLGFSAVSGVFSHDVELTDRPAVLLAIALVAAGFVFLLTVPLIRRSQALDGTHQKTIFWIIVAGGLAMRLALMGSTPALEDDYYRYLWDGGVTAHGYNPYLASPDDAQAEPYFYSLQPLAQQSGIVIERVNHSELTTVYPPVAQAAFALAHFVSPWSLEAWRALCLAAEIATLLMLLALLDHIGRCRLWVALYWLSPLAAKEFINSAHMDAIVMPLVLGAALLSLKQRHVSAVATLGLAIGAKFWPILLAPLILRPLISKPPRFGAAILLLGALCVAASAPMLSAGLGETSGLASYALNWRNNSAHYGLIEKLAAFVLKPFALDVRIPGQLTRLALAGSAGLFALWTARQPIADGCDLLRRLGLVTAAIVLLSPSQFPWYALWVLPFAVFVPWSGLLLMTALISIYYAGFHFSSRETYSTYRDGVVFAIWIPVWTLLAYEAWRAGMKGKPPLIEAGTPHA